MKQFMVVRTFRPNTVNEDGTAMIPEEIAQVRILEEEGVLKGVRVSVARDKVFVDVFSKNTEGAEATVRRLPMSKWWEIDTYQIAMPS
jgi:hypothetical protein